MYDEVYLLQSHHQRSCLLQQSVRQCPQMACPAHRSTGTGKNRDVLVTARTQPAYHGGDTSTAGQAPARITISRLKQALLLQHIVVALRQAQRITCTTCVIPLSSRHCRLCSASLEDRNKPGSTRSGWYHRGTSDWSMITRAGAACPCTTLTYDSYVASVDLTLQTSQHMLTGAGPRARVHPSVRLIGGSHTCQAGLSGGQQ